MTKKEYEIKPDIKMLDLRDVLEHLKDDANDEAVALIKLFTRYGDLEVRANAMYYMGQTELIDSLLWALSGEAESDGCEPTIGIKPRGEL